MNQIRPETRAAIIEAAFLVFNETPSASLADVAARAGVGRATLHRYFSGRADLMRALALTAMEELDRAIEEKTASAESYEEGFRLSLHAMVPLANRQWFLSQEGLEADPEIAAAYAASQKQTLADVKRAQAEGAFAADLPAEWIATAYEHLTYAAWQLVRDGEETP